jgi:predicted transcriptional regulator
MENHGGMILTGKTYDSSIRGLWQSYQQSSKAMQEELAKEMNFALQSISFILQRVLLHAV